MSVAMQRAFAAAAVEGGPGTETGGPLMDLLSATLDPAQAAAAAASRLPSIEAPLAGPLVQGVITGRLEIIILALRCLKNRCCILFACMVLPRM
mmetsp:Transcript_7472/g.9590  ORF Transcript_7472/g.9590 Transcript_7472/m.9590 type:complete len:94 (-) Transcript_7472:945-1226(-)